MTATQFSAHEQVLLDKFFDKLFARVYGVNKFPLVTETQLFFHMSKFYLTSFFVINRPICSSVWGEQVFLDELPSATYLCLFTETNNKIPWLFSFGDSNAAFLHVSEQVYLRNSPPQKRIGAWEQSKIIAEIDQLQRNSQSHEREYENYQFSSFLKVWMKSYQSTSFQKSRKLNPIQKSLMKSVSPVTVH